MDGRVLTEGVGVPPSGEIWNVPFEGGIVEDLISTRAIKQMYRESTGLEREVAEIATGAPRDSAAVEVFRKFGASLGHVLRILLHDFSPQVVVLGGGIAHASHLFLPKPKMNWRGLRVSCVSLPWATARRSSVLEFRGLPRQPTHVQPPPLQPRKSN